MNKYYKKANHRTKYREYLKVLNGIMRLTPREMDVASLLVKLDVEWPDNDIDKDIISTACRKYMMKHANITKSNLSFTLKSLKTKGLLITPAIGSSWVNPIFIPKSKTDKYTVEFIIDFKDDENSII